MRSFPVIIIVVVVAALMAGVLLAFGWFNAAPMPDTPGYMLAVTGDDPWGTLRHPLYGWLLLWLEKTGFGPSAVPVLQFVLHVAAAIILMAAGGLVGLDRRAMAALGLACLCGQTVVIWGRALIPELPAVSLLAIAIALAMAATRERLFWGCLLLLGLTLGAAYTLRPIVIPAVLMLPLLYLVLCRIDSQGWRIARAAMMMAALTAPFLLQSAHRYRVVGDFGLVSFGGFGSMGVAAQVLTPDIVARLPEAQQSLALTVLDAKQKAVDAQTAMPLFRNSSGERSFLTSAIDGFDTLARNFDEILWGQLSKLQGKDETWVAFNARMGALSAAVMRAAPERYAMWAAGATSRLVGRIFTYNVAFLLALLAFGAVALVNIVRYGAALGGASGRSWTMLSLIVLTWGVSTSALTVVVAFPAMRYTDTAGLLLTALPLYGLFLALAKTNSDDPR